MPERAPDQPTVERAEAEPSAEQLQQQFEEWEVAARQSAEKLFDDCQAQGKRPIDVLRDSGRDLRNATEVFGSARIEAFVAALDALDYSGRDDFVAKLMAINEPFRQARFFDPEVRARLAAIERRHQKDKLPAGNLRATVHPSEWQLNLTDGAVVAHGDDVVEIGWPDDPTTGPRGAREIEATLRTLAQSLATRPEIKAVVAQSWMMSHPIAQRLGFELIDEAKIEDDITSKVVGWATSARADKPYRHNVSATDVKVGAISRQEFLRRYG